MDKAFDFKCKLAENYTAAIVGAFFIWQLVNALERNGSAELEIADAIASVAPFIVTFLDRKSAGASLKI